MVVSRMRKREGNLDSLAIWTRTTEVEPKQIQSFLETFQNILAKPLKYFRSFWTETRQKIGEAGGSSSASTTPRLPPPATPPPSGPDQDPSHPSVLTRVNIPPWRPSRNFPPRHPEAQHCFIYPDLAHIQYGY